MTILAIFLTVICGASLIGLGWFAKNDQQATALYIVGILSGIAAMMIIIWVLR